MNKSIETEANQTNIENKFKLKANSFQSLEKKNVHTRWIKAKKNENKMFYFQFFFSEIIYLIDFAECALISSK